MRTATRRSTRGSRRRCSGALPPDGISFALVCRARTTILAAMRALAVLVLLLVAARASAEDAVESPPLVASVGTGVAIAMGSLAVGGAMLLSHESTAGRKAGAYTIFTGFTLAPFVSHAIAGEWLRGTIFAAVGIAVTSTAVILIETSPGLMKDGSLGKRRFLGALYGLALLNAGVGLFDSLGAAERADRRQLALVPMLGPTEIGLAFGGRL